MPLDRLLQRWLAPLALPDFVHDYLSRRVLFRPPSAERLATIASSSTWCVEELLDLPGIKPLAWFHGTDGRHLTAEVSPKAAARLHSAGTTLYLLEAAPCVPIGDAIARELGVPRHRIQCALFCNRPQAHTPAHFDPVDTITMQLVGHKRWRLAPNRLVVQPTSGWALGDGTEGDAELWTYAHDELPAQPPAAEEILLEPGALLSVPRGHWHSTESGEDSVSLHIHHAPLPWLDAVLVSLRALLLRDPAWRRGADALWDPQAHEANAQAAAGLLASLEDAVRRLAPEDVLVTTPPAATDDTRRWVPRARAGFVVEREHAADGMARVTFSVLGYGTDRITSVEMSRPHLAACRMLWKGEVTTDELCARVPELGKGEVESLVALMVEAGVLRAA